VEDFNKAANSTIKYKQRINRFSDMSLDQIMSVYSQTLVSEIEMSEKDTETKNQMSERLVYPLPKAVGKIETIKKQNQIEFFHSLNILNFQDWRDENVVSPVQTQGNCGSCWAFSSVGELIFFG
jgi:C1A family cysteine protease